MNDIFDKIRKDMGPIGRHAKQSHGYFSFPKLEGELGAHMTFRFTSDNATVAAGYTLKWECIGPSYYADTIPTWVKVFNDRDPVARYLGTDWTPLLPASAYSERSANSSSL